MPLKVVRRGEQLVMHGHQMALHQVRLARRHQADGDIGLAHGQIQLAVVQYDRHLNFRVIVEEFADARRQPEGAEGHRGGDLQRSARPFAAFRQLGLGHGQLGEDVTRRTIEQFTLLGQNQPAGVPMEQRHSETFLKSADLPTDRRLAKIERFPRMGETSRLGNGVEHPKFIPVHAPTQADALFPRQPFGQDRQVHCLIYSAATKLICPWWARKRSASRALMHPVPAAVTAWRYVLSWTSPAAKTPGTLVWVVPGLVTR